MIEITGNIWKLRGPDDYVVVTTNGSINKKGEAVMGRGVALQAKTLYPHLPKELARRLTEWGLEIEIFEDIKIVTFPVKYEWWQRADLLLINQSIEQLITFQRLYKVKVLMPRPGCGNGSATWEDVKPIVSILDDNFTVVNL